MSFWIIGEPTNVPYEDWENGAATWDSNKKAFAYCDSNNLELITAPGESRRVSEDEAIAFAIAQLVKENRPP